jgi:hypothetical protein
MGSVFAKARCCTSLNSRGKVSAEDMRRGSFRDFVKDLNCFWKSSDASTRSTLAAGISTSN